MVINLILRVDGMGARPHNVILRRIAPKNPWNDPLVRFIIGILRLFGAVGPESNRRASPQNDITYFRYATPFAIV
jgi:hypothetical protein